MISYICGELTRIEKDSIVVDNGGIGYHIFIPMSMFDFLPSTGQTVKIYTYLNVREDAMQLFGFLTHDDLDVFKMLITVSGIGPKGALGILSILSADDLRFAVLSGDDKAISKAPGIGKKTAQKMILELKDKMKLEDVFEHETLPGGEDYPQVSSVKNDVVMALLALGYSNAEALRAVNGCEISDGTDSDELLKLALKRIMVL